MSSTAASRPGATELALFPLQTVLFPGGRLALQVFEARYLDLMSRCLRARSPFGVVWLREGSEVRRPGDGDPVLADVGVEAHIDAVDMPRTGLMHVALLGGSRFAIESLSRQDNGLWQAQASMIDDDPPAPPLPAHAPAVRALHEAFASLRARGQVLAEDPRLDDAGWVSNRCCELLPLDPAQRQALMVMRDPLARLSAVVKLLERD